MSEQSIGRYKLINVDGYIESSYRNKYLMDNYFTKRDESYYVFIDYVTEVYGRPHGYIHHEENSAAIGKNEWKYFELCKPYNSKASLQDIIDDGWSRGFDIQQTLNECSIMGFSTDTKHVRTEWDKWDYKFRTENLQKMSDDFESTSKEQLLTEDITL